MTRSQTASRHGIDNTPNEEQSANLIVTCSGLEILRRYIKRPIIVSSGLRVLELNRKIGSSDTSAHIPGLAADITAPGLTVRELMDSIRACLKFDTVIDEFHSWVHLSFDPRFRNRVLQARRIQGKTKYEVIS